MKKHEIKFLGVRKSARCHACHLAERIGTEMDDNKVIHSRRPGRPPPYPTVPFARYHPQLMGSASILDKNFAVDIGQRVDLLRAIQVACKKK